MKQKGLKRMAALLAITVAMTFTLVIPQDAMAATRTPSKVSSVKVSSYDYNKVKISWSKAKNAKNYRVYQATSKNGKYKRISTTTKRSLVKSGLTTGKTYYYKVRGVNGKKLDKLSSPKAVKPKLRTATGVKVAKASNSSIKISWKKVNGAKGYQIYRATSSKGKYKKLKTTTKLSYVNSGLTKNKTYYYKVRSYRKVGKKYVYSSFTKGVGKKLVVASSKPTIQKPTITQPTNPQPSKQTLAEIRKEMLDMVNKERAKANVPPLKPYDVIDKTAQIKAEDMYQYKYFDHYSPRLGMFYDQFAAAGLMKAGGENIASGATEVSVVMNAWMNSPDHKSNILYSGYTHLGIGYVNGYWVQQFYVSNTTEF